MRVCYFGWYERTYPRNELLRQGLEHAGVEVVECRVPDGLAPVHGSPPVTRQRPLARAVYELRQLTRVSGRAAWLARNFSSYRGQVDAVILPEFNQGLAPLAWLMAKRAGVPLIVDFFVSLYDTAVLDRGSLDPHRPRARWRMQVDKLALRLASRLLVDTWQHAEYYREQLGADLTKARLIPIGAPERDCHPTPLPSRTADRPADPEGPQVPEEQGTARRPMDDSRQGSEQQRATRRPLQILYFGSYIPFHGVSHILAAARLLRDDPRFRFVLVGAGQTLGPNRADYDADPSGNVEFRDRIPQEEVPGLIAEADVCLGVFGTHPKAGRVITNKVWQCLASGRPVITADGPAPRSVTEDGRHCLLVPAGDPEAIAAALRRLADEPELAKQLAKEAAELVRERYSTAPIGRQLAAVVAEVAH